MHFVVALMMYLGAACVLIGTPVAAYNLFLADYANYKRHGEVPPPVPPKIQAYLDRKAIPVPVQEPPPPVTSVSIAPVVLSPPVRAEYVAADERPAPLMRLAKRTPKPAAPTEASAQSKEAEAKPQPAATPAEPDPPRDLRLITRMDRGGLN